MAFVKGFYKPEVVESVAKKLTIARNDMTPDEQAVFDTIINGSQESEVEPHVLPDFFGVEATSKGVIVKVIPKGS